MFAQLKTTASPCNSLTLPLREEKLSCQVVLADNLCRLPLDLVSQIPLLMPIAHPGFKSQ